MIKSPRCYDALMIFQDLADEVLWKGYLAHEKTESSGAGMTVLMAQATVCQST